MLSATLDTSCALNFLALDDEEPDSALLQLLHVAFRHRALVGVTAEAHDEVARHADRAQADRQLQRLAVFGRVEVRPAQRQEVSRRAARLHEILFRDASPGSRRDDHNKRDCRQLAAHELVGRDLFVTRDGGLLRKAEQIGEQGIRVASPADAIAALRVDRPVGVSQSGGVAVRAAALDADESAIRETLAPLRDSYPDFDGWLTKALPGSRISVAEMDGEIGAVALSQEKDPRVRKLSAFMVAEDYRGSGLGGHLLWSELRAWADGTTAKVYVTVSSRQRDLLPFFGNFGFLVEGISARRYSDHHAEFVLAKHFAYGRFGPGELDDFAERVARPVLLSPDFTGPTALSMALGGTLKWSGEGAALRLEQLDAHGEPVRSWSLLDLERIFFPVVLAIPERPVLLVPIEERWAGALIEFAGEQLELSSERDDQRRLLRPDNAYYCYPTAYDAARPGTPILFYVTSPRQAVVGEARIVESELAPPEDLFVRFGDLGVYEPGDIRSHTREGGQHDGCAMGLRFAQYQPFPTPVSRAEMLEALGRNLSGPQGLTPLTFEDFEAIRRRGRA